MGTCPVVEDNLGKLKLILYTSFGRKLYALLDGPALDEFVGEVMAHQDYDL